MWAIAGIITHVTHPVCFLSPRYLALYSAVPPTGGRAGITSSLPPQCSSTYREGLLLNCGTVCCRPVLRSPENQSLLINPPLPPKLGQRGAIKGD